MKKLLLLGLAVILTATLAGCGGHDDSPTLVVRDILSTGGTRDGDISLDSSTVPATFSVFTAADPPNTIQVGIDPVNPSIETRGFITFPLDSIPPGAVIQRATVLLPILRVNLISPPSVEILVDMVSFPPLDSLLTQGDMASVFDSSILLVGPSFEVFPGDAGTDKQFDATDAVIEAGRLGFSTFQVRLTGSFGQVIIDDLDPASGGLTPLLSVEFI